MSGLFRAVDFVMHSGEPSSWKIDCDALGDDDLKTLAKLVGERCRFGAVQGVPRGGLRLAAALQPHVSTGPLLIVDDVLTTGASMDAARRAAEGEPIGVVIFARARPPAWVQAIFQFALA